MNLDLLVEMELNRWDWSNIMECDGPATKIPSAIRELISADTPQEARAAYWKLENHVVVQGGIFEAAVYTVPVLVASWVRNDRPTHFVIATMNLFFQILAGDVRSEERERGLHDLKERCIAAMREGLWVLYAYYSNPILRLSVGDVIAALDKDEYRLKYLDDHLKKNESK
jgi:hypothetical protein